MQKIFYNAKIETIDEKASNAEAFLVNDENIVFVGSNEEVLQMKQDDTKLVDLKNKTVLPAFFNDGLCLFGMIEQKLKESGKEKLIVSNEDIDENYENFPNYETYKKEFVKLQKQLIKLGVGTVKELFVSIKAFAFWKKLANDGEIKIDMIGYVDYKSSKKVMDENCRSYRKYKNHFRLGGYTVSIDGSMLEKKAWLNKPYKHEKGYVGYSEYFDEELSFLFKTALEEKKQLLVFTHGDRAVDQFLRCFEETVKKEKVEDVFKPIAMNCGLLSKKQLQKMKEIGVVPSFNVLEFAGNEDYFKKTIGNGKLKNMQPFLNSKETGLKFLVHGFANDFVSNVEILKKVSERKKHGLFETAQAVSFDEMLKESFLNSANSCFDFEQKGSLESGKYANFVVFDEDAANLKSDSKIDLYIFAEKV